MMRGQSREKNNITTSFLSFIASTEGIPNKAKVVAVSGVTIMAIRLVSTSGEVTKTMNFSIPVDAMVKTSRLASCA